MLLPGKVFKIGFSAFLDALAGQIRGSVERCCQMGIVVMQLWRGFPVVGNSKVVVAHTDPRSDTSKHSDALLRKWVTHHQITATDDKIVECTFQHALKCMQVSVYV